MIIERTTPSNVQVSVPGEPGKLVIDDAGWRVLGADGQVVAQGAPAQIAQAAKAYHVFYQKHPEGASYTMDHTAIVYLMDPKGRFVKPLDLTAPPADVARQIAEAMQTTA